jgi:hypothetical protein
VRDLSTASDGSDANLERSVDLVSRSSRAEGYIGYMNQQLAIATR